MLTATFLLSLLLSPATEPAAGDSVGGETAPSSAPAQVQPLADLVAALEPAQDAANQNPPEGAPALRVVLEGLYEHAPALAADAELQADRAFAQLVLARALSLAGETAAAEAALDEAIRSARGEALPAEELGPSLRKMYQARGKALAEQGKATLTVNCVVPCRIYINEREAEASSELLLGEYRVWVADAGGERENKRERVTLSEADTEVEIFYTPKPKPKPVVELPPSTPVKPPRVRLLPRSGELAGASVGAVLTSIGAIVIHQTGQEPHPPIKAGYALVGVGGALFVTTAILLIVDEAREERRGDRRQAHVSRKRGAGRALAWPLRF